MRPFRPGEQPTLPKVAQHIERRMAGKTGRVTLHYKDGRLKRAEYTDFEDVAAMPVEEERAA